MPELGDVRDVQCPPRASARARAPSPRPRRCRLTMIRSQPRERRALISANRGTLLRRRAGDHIRAGAPRRRHPRSRSAPAAESAWPRRVWHHSVSTSGVFGVTTMSTVLDWFAVIQDVARRTAPQRGERCLRAALVRERRSASRPRPAGRARPSNAVARNGRGMEGGAGQRRVLAGAAARGRRPSPPSRIELGGLGRRRARPGCRRHEVGLGRGSSSPSATAGRRAAPECRSWLGTGAVAGGPTDRATQ